MVLQKPVSRMDLLTEVNCCQLGPVLFFVFHLPSLFTRPSSSYGSRTSRQSRAARPFMASIRFFIAFLLFRRHCDGVYITRSPSPFTSFGFATIGLDAAA